jgi:hypothetical protein
VSFIDPQTEGDAIYSDSSSVNPTKKGVPFTPTHTKMVARVRARTTTKICNNACNVASERLKRWQNTTAYQAMRLLDMLFVDVMKTISVRKRLEEVKQ